MKEENHTLGISLNQENSFLFGHDEQISFLLDRLRTSQIPNAWLFHGPMGIGKASLALNVGKVLSNIDFSKKNAKGEKFTLKEQSWEWFLCCQSKNAAWWGFNGPRLQFPFSCFCSSFLCLFVVRRRSIWRIFSVPYKRMLVAIFKGARAPWRARRGLTRGAP